MNRKNILVIDDEREICEALKDTLEFETDEEFVVDYAITAEEAFRKIDENNHDAIYVDIKLSGAASGIDIIKYIQEMTASPPVFVISAIPEKGMEELLREEGIKGFIKGYFEKTDSMATKEIIQKTRELMTK